MKKAFSASIITILSSTSVVYALDMKAFGDKILGKSQQDLASLSHIGLLTSLTNSIILYSWRIS
ncbi:hypothetical protein ACH5RR_038128, partial [Cinchona calisaya]